MTRIIKRYSIHIALLMLGLLANPAGAGIGSGGGTGVLVVDTPEMLPPGRMSFSASWKLNSIKIGDRRLHTFISSPSLTVGLSPGLEASGSLPLHAFYRTDTDETDVGSLFKEDFSFRQGDMALKLRTGIPLAGDRFRLGVEAIGSAPVGSDRFEAIYSSTDSVRVYTSDEWNYGGMLLSTLDLTGPGGGPPVRLHGNLGYFFNRDESAFRYREMHSYPLPVAGPMKSEDNDLMLLAIGAEFTVRRQAAFVELATEQFVNSREILKTRENPITLTPGLRFLFPGGVGLTTAMSFNLSDDDKKTAFDPGDVFPDWELRAVLSLGDIFQSRRSRLAGREGETGDTAPLATKTPESLPVAQSPGLAASVADTAVAGDARSTRVQGRISKTSGPSRMARRAPGFADSDRDGVPDAQDRCPLQAEDHDGFRDSDGCPDLDNDLDGILDPDDLCPNSPEDHLGPNPLDGCPSPFAPRSHLSGQTLDAMSATGQRAAGRSAAPSPGQQAKPAEASGPAPSASRPDSDRDGILDEFDLCPFQAEDPDGFEDTDGCPDLDNDGDGILDKSDRCPNAAETYNDFKDDDGCPDRLPNESPQAVPGQSSLDLRLREIESRLIQLQARPDLRATSGPAYASQDPLSDVDGDGVADTFDRCPEIPEDVDGWQDQDGCPDLDNDGDGIKDRDDRCPNAPESMNGFEDEDGCPDTVARPAEVPAPMVAAPQLASPSPPVAPERSGLLDTIYFPSGGAQISFELKSRLDDLVGDLREASPGRIEIRGFSDSRGPEEVNLRISRQRAESVRAYLRDRGIDDMFLKVVALGEANPIDDNATEAGKARNRRVEIHRYPSRTGKGNQ